MSQIMMDSTSELASPERASTSHTSAASASTANNVSRFDPLPSSHPLSLRIRSVLDASAAVSGSANDEATLMALQELERRYGSRSSRRSRARVPARNRNHDLFALFNGESSSSKLAPVVAKINTERARQCVESDACDAHKEATREFLAALEDIDAAIQDVGYTLQDLRTTCSTIDDKMESASSSTQHLLQHARGIRKQRATTSQNAAILDTFLDKFSLTPEEHDFIVSHAQPVGPRLFAIVDKLKRIRSDSQVLLVGQDEGAKGGMRAGIDVIEESTTLIDAAQQKIAKWLQTEMRTFSREGFDSGDRIRAAVARLDNREDLLRPALTTLAATRANLLSTAFHRALTVGGSAPSHLPRPIELHAHDPLRYVGDMLAWVHQALATERDFLTGIFAHIGGEEEAALEGRRRPGQRRRGLEGSVDWSSRDLDELSRAEQWIRRVLDRVIEGCCSPLKNRIEHTIRSQAGCITTFRLTSFIQFYRVTMERTLGSKAAMSIALRDLSILAYRAFVGTLDHMTAGLVRFSGTPDDDLSAPPPVIGASATLKELLVAHQSSLEETDLFGDALPMNDLSDNEARDFATIVQRLIQPILDLCDRMGNAHVERRPRGKSEVDATWERNLFTANCLACLKSVTEPFSFTARANSQLDASIEEHLDALTVSHHERLLQESGLEQVVKTLRADRPDASPQSQAVDYREAFADFETFLASPTLLSSPHLGLLTSPSMRATVHARALELIARDYEVVTQRLSQEALASSDQPTGVKTQGPLRDADQVRLLLGIDRRNLANA